MDRILENLDVFAFLMTYGICSFIGGLLTMKFWQERRRERLEQERLEQQRLAAWRKAHY